MKVSILTTVYNRSERMLRNTLHMLRRNDLEDAEIVIVDDGSTREYPKIKNYIDCYDIPVRWIRVSTVEDRPGTYNINGYNNPAYAWNCALEAAEGRIICMLSSDCLVPPHGVTHAKRCGKSVWMANVVDMDSGMVYLGRSRVYPMGWFMSWDREVVGDIRQDENFLKGIDYDDNDFTARLGLKTGRIEIDSRVTVFHQSHEAIAYTDGGLGHDTNELYIRQKWGGGIPWIEGGPIRAKVSHNGPMLVVDVVQSENVDAEVFRRTMSYIGSASHTADAETLSEQHGLA